MTSENAHSLSDSNHPPVPASVVLTPEAINAVFAAAVHQIDYIVGLHRLVYGDAAWDRIAGLNDYVKCSKEVSIVVFKAAIHWDKCHHPEVVAGGSWMNSGWSAIGMPATGWEVIPAPVTWKVGLT